MRPWVTFIIQSSGDRPQVLGHARQSGYSIFILILHYLLLPVIQALKTEFTWLYIIFPKINYIIPNDLVLDCSLQIHIINVIMVAICKWGGFVFLECSSSGCSRPAGSRDKVLSSTAEHLPSICKAWVPFPEQETKQKMTRTTESCSQLIFLGWVVYL